MSTEKQVAVHALDMECVQRKLDLILEMRASDGRSPRGKEKLNFTPVTPIVSGEGAKVIEITKDRRNAPSLSDAVVVDDHTALVSSNSQWRREIAHPVVGTDMVSCGLSFIETLSMLFIIQKMYTSLPIHSALLSIYDCRGGFCLTGNTT